MAKIAQFRCPRCLKLLLKYDKAKDEMLYQDDYLQSQYVKETNDTLVKCPKCDTISKITPEGLESIVIKKKVVESEKKIEKVIVSG